MRRSSKKINWIVSSGWILGLIVLVQRSPAQDLTGVFDRAARSIARVTVVKSGGENTAVGTGFSCAESRQVITAYHLIVGAERVLVRFPSQAAPSVATVVKVHKRADLALLQLPENAEIEPMSLGGAPPRGSQVLTLGYAYGAARVESLSYLKIREIGGTKLEEMLSDQHKSEIERLGFPDPQLDLLNLEGHPAPGFSGSPVFDTRGRVIGVINGGLEAGAGAISWAVPVSEVEELFRQPDYRPSRGDVSIASQRSRLLFGADLRTVQQGPTIQFDRFRLVQRRTRTLEEMQRTTEDPTGLGQILSGGSVTGVSFNNTRFDIYEDTQSGACIAAPHGAQFENRGGILVATLEDDRFGLLVRVDALTSPREAQPTAIRFENYLTGLSPGYTWLIDIPWTYQSPLQRFDGALVMRRGTAYFAPFRPRKYVFHTVATRGNYAIGVAAINYGFDQETDPALRRSWLELLLSVHLSQFSQ